MPDRGPILVTHDITRRFGSLTAVDHVSLSIARGEVFGLLGRNGAGKSTLIKMLATLLLPSSGSATVEGYDIVRDAAAVRRAIGYVPQALSADSELTGFENLLVFAKLYDIPRAEQESRIRSALEFMDLGDFAHRLVKGYSGGMIRRLEIAQSTLHRPRVLFLDEPTVGLDPVARQTVWEHVELLATRYRSTILLTTHYLEEAERLCDRISILNAGRVVASGTCDELRRAIGPQASLEDAFAKYTGTGADAEGAYDETSRTRRTTGRLA